MSEQLTTAELGELHRRLIALHGDTMRRHGRALQFDEKRFVVDCLACRGTGVRQTRPGVTDRAKGFICRRCRGTTIEVVVETAAIKICGAGAIDYLPRRSR